ncbi:small glutamine-rich tetratricopeptide repeat-containing protein beta-like [Diabrotica undecimpunctata]|uniref:small glutamine-rich tetratricopeptide repeat-containing protein beta-like n=1 Tax=Diabrotica undecimpunctata TaxID=50387 RepID=UPI003B642A68
MDLENTKKYFMAHVVNFLQDEVVNGNMNEEKKESVEVAIQCLETAYDIQSDIKNEASKTQLDLLSLIPVNRRAEVTEDQIKEAEIYKNNGNTHMKNCAYSAAVTEYTKAININPNNAVYYCNRAAAYSRLEKHLDAINDCQQAIKLDPTYGKAYGRLGIAYSNLNRYEEACKAYAEALKHDPGNEMYEANYKLAEEKLFGNRESAAPTDHRNLDMSQFINNPNLINMATQMLSDTNFRNLMSRFMSTNQSGDPNLDVLIQTGQTLANRMLSTDPTFVEHLRRSIDPQNLMETNTGSGESAPGNLPTTDPSFIENLRRSLDPQGQMEPESSEQENPPNPSQKKSQ